jgi:hypothetical protein
MIKHTSFVNPVDETGMYLRLIIRYLREVLFCVGSL